MREHSGSPRDRRGEDRRDETAVRRLIERVYSKGELTLVDELVTPDYVGRSTVSANVYRGPAGLKAHVMGLRTTFNGFTVEIDDLAVVGDTFSASWTARGTQERRFLGVDPSCTIGRAGEEPHGSEIAVPGTTTGTVRDGTVHESRMEWDASSLRRQLGSSAADDDVETGPSTRRSHPADESRTVRHTRLVDAEMPSIASSPIEPSGGGRTDLSKSR